MGEPIGDTPKPESERSISNPEYGDAIKNIDALKSRLEAAKKAGADKKQGIETTFSDYPSIPGMGQVLPLPPQTEGKTLITPNIYTEMMTAIGKLESKIAVCNDRLDSMIEVISGKESTYATSLKTTQLAYIYFENRDTFNSGIQLLQNRNIQPKILGAGGMAIPEEAKSILAEGRIQFEEVENLEEIYANKERVASYRSQVKEYHRIG